MGRLSPVPAFESLIRTVSLGGLESEALHVQDLDYPPIKIALRKVLPKSELLSLTKCKVETPAKQSGDYLVVNKCLPHNCPSDLAMIVLDLHSEKIWAGFFSREENRMSPRWYGNADEYTALPNEIQRQFQSSH